ncbi:sigma-70 family RNA polymerase sigma factor [Kribbella sp. NPDC050241]|uniref:sigma-70 family RNA polymerase sigma factor n=1 Tax=Kribbella sp. NPDC050241 TaxID=3364115 RepID=UPI00379F25FC
MPYETFDDFARVGSPRLLGAARLLLGDPQLAEDLTQETLIRVYRSWPSIRVDAAIDSYAYRTLVRLVHRRRMRGFHRREVPTSLVPDQVVGEVDSDHRAPLVRACLLELPARQRATLVLRFYADLSVEDTAKAMRCTPGTVKSQTAKGLRNLKALMTSDDAGEFAQQGETR